MSSWCKSLNSCYANNNEPDAINLIRDIKCYFAQDLFSTEIKMPLSYLFDEYEGLFILIDQVKLVVEWKTFVIESLALIAEFTKKFMSEMENYIAAVVSLSFYNYSAAALRKKAMVCLLEVTRGLGHAPYLARIPRFLEEIANLANTGKQNSPSVKEIAFIIIGEMSTNYPELIEEHKIRIWRCFQQVLENGNNPVGLLKGAIIGLIGYLTNFTSVISKPNLELIFTQWILGSSLDNDLLIESVLRLLTKHADLWTPYLIYFYKTKPDRFDRLWQIYSGSESKRKIAQKAILTVYEVLAKCMDGSEGEHGINVHVKLDLKRRIWDNLSETKSYWQKKQSLQMLADLKSHSHQLMDPDTKKAVLHFLEQWIEKTVCEFEEYDMWKMGNADVFDSEHETFDEEVLKTMENAALLVEVSSLLEDCRPESLIRHLVSNQHRCPVARKKRVLVKPILTVNTQLRQIIITLLINNSCDIVRTANTPIENRYLYLWRELFHIDQEDNETATPNCVSETFRIFLEAAVQSLDMLDCSEVAKLDYDIDNKPENQTLEFVANVCHLITEILNFDTIDEYLLENNLDILKSLINKCLHMDETIYQYGDPTSCASGVCELIGELSRVVYRTMKTDSPSFLGIEILGKIKNFYSNLTDVNRYKTETMFANSKTLLTIPSQIVAEENYIQIIGGLKVLLNHSKRDYYVLFKVFANINEIIESRSWSESSTKYLNSLKPDFINILYDLSSVKQDVLHRNIKWHVLKIVGYMDTQIVEKNNDWSKDIDIGLGFNFHQWRSCSQSLMLSVPCPGCGNLKINLNELSEDIIRHGEVTTLQSIALMLCCSIQNSDSIVEPVLVSRSACIVRELARRGDELAARISRWMVTEEGGRREMYIHSILKNIGEESDPLTIDVCVESLGVCCRHKPQCLTLILQSLYTLNVDSIQDTQSKMMIIKTITPVLAENEDLFKDHATKLLYYTVTTGQSIQSNEAFDVLTHKIIEKLSIFEKNNLITILVKLTKFTFENMKSFENVSKKVISFGKKIMKDVTLNTWIDFTSAIKILQSNVQILLREFKKHLATFNEDEFISLCDMLRVILNLQRVLSKNLQERHEYVHIFNSFNTGVCMETILSSIVNVFSRRNVKLSMLHEIYSFLEVNSELLMSKWISETSWILINLLYKQPTENLDTLQISIIKRCFSRYKNILSEDSDTWRQFETKFKSENYTLIEHLKSVERELNNTFQMRNYKMKDEIVVSIRRLILFDECISLFIVQESLYDAQTEEMTDLNIDKPFKDCVIFIAIEETMKWFDILNSKVQASDNITGVTWRFVKDVVRLALKVNGDTLLRKIMLVGINSADIQGESHFLSTFNIEIAEWMLESGRTICMELLDCGAGARVIDVADVLLRYCLTRDAKREHRKMVLEVVSQKWPVIKSSESKMSTRIELLKLLVHIAQDILCEPGSEPLTWILTQMCSESTSADVKIQLIDLLPTFLMRKADEEDIGEDIRNAMRSYSGLASARAIQTIARVCSASGHPRLVEALVQMVIVCSNSVRHDAVLVGAMRTLGARGLTALQPLRVLCDAALGDQDAKARLTVLERLCSPLLLWSSPQCCERLFTELWPRLEKVVMFKLKPGAVLNESKIRINMTFVSYIAAYTILELLIAKLPRESLMLASSPLSQLVVPDNKSNWALPKRLCTICSTWRRSSEAPADTAGAEAKENYRKFQCAVYRSFAAAICRMQPATKYYDRQFSKEVWPLIVGNGTTYNPRPFFGKRSLPRKVAVSIASGGGGWRGSSSSLSRTSLSQSSGGSLRRRLFFQTLSDDVFQYDFLNLEVNEEGGNSGESYAPSSVELDHSEGWNQHECMAVLVNMIEDLATRTNIDTPSTDDRVWLANLVNGLNDDSMLPAPRRFLAQVVCNCRVSLRKFANLLRIPLLKAVLHNKELQASTLDSVDLDMFKTMVEWSDTQPSESEMCPDEKQLVQTAAHALVQSASQGCAVLTTQAMAILKQLAPKWKLQRLAPVAALLQLLQSVTAKKTGLSMCIILVPYLPLSQCDELRAHLLELAKSSQTSKLAAEALGACFGGEKKRAVSASALGSYVDEVMRGSDIERINLLFHTQKHCPDVCSRNYFNWTISMTPKVPLAVRKTCLKIIATHLGSACCEPLLLEDVSALMVTLNPAQMLKDGADGLVLHVLEIVKNMLRFPVDRWEPHVEAVCNLLSGKDQKGSEEIRKEGYLVILAAFDRIMGIEADTSTSVSKSPQTCLLSLANFTHQNAFVRRLASLMASALLDEDADIAELVFSSLSAKLSSTKFMDLRLMESFLLLILIPLSDISKQHNADDSVEAQRSHLVELTTLTSLVLDTCRNSVEYKEAKLRMVPLILEPDADTAAGGATMLSYTTVHKSVRYVASFSVTAKGRKQKSLTQTQHNEISNEVYPNVVVSMDSVIQPLLQCKDTNHSSSVLFVCLFKSILSQEDTDLSQRMSPLILQSISYLSQSAIQHTTLLRALLEVFRLCVRHINKSLTNETMFKCLRRKYKGLGLDELIKLVMEEVEMFGRDVDDDLGQPSSKRLCLENQASSTENDMSLYAEHSQKDTFSIAESTKLMELLGDWDSLTKNDKRQYIDSMPNIWTNSQKFVTSLDEYFGCENQDRTSREEWDWLQYGHQLLKGNNRYFAQNWVRKSQWPCAEFCLKAMLELSEWEIAYHPQSQTTDLNFFNAQRLTDATTTTRDTLIPNALFLMLRKSLIENLPSPFDNTMTQESSIASDKLLEQRSREMKWIRHALDLGLWKQAGQCIERNSIYLTNEESLEWFLLRSRCVMHKAFHLGKRDALHSQTLASHMTSAISSLKDLSEFSPLKIVLEMKAQTTLLVAEFGVSTVERVGDLDGLSDSILEIIGESNGANLLQSYVECVLNTLSNAYYIPPEQAQMAIAGQMEASRRLLHYFDAALENDVLDNIDLKHRLRIELVHSLVSCMKQGGDVMLVMAVLLHRIQQSRLEDWQDAITLFNEEIDTIPTSNLVSTWPYLLPCIPNITQAVAKICMRIAEEFPRAVSQQYRIWRQDFCPDVSRVTNGNMCEHVFKSLDALLLSSAFPSDAEVIPDEALISVCNPLSVLNHFCHQLHQHALQYNTTQKQKSEKSWKQIMSDMDRDLFQGLAAKGSAFQLLQEYRQKLQLIPSYGAPNFQATTVKILVSIIEKLERQLLVDSTSSISLNSLSPLLANYSGDENVPEQLSQFMSGMQGVTIVGFLKKVHVMRGAKCQPVVLSVWLSNGRVLRMLLKRAEWRQDHLVQYTQKAMNKIFATSPHLKRRHIMHEIKTYKVVPLRQDVVAIEWLDGCCTLRQLAAHGLDLDNIREEYANVPDDALVEISRVSAVNRYHSAAAKVPRYHIRSAIERTSNSVDDFIKHKKTYVESLAVMSIVHWILGVGDRHLSNFLYNASHGWVCGVDSEHTLGSAVCHQRSPELVPARLTPRLCAVTHNTDFRIIMEDALSVFRLRWRELFASISLLCVSSTIDEELLIKILRLKRKLNGQLNSFEATLEELDHNTLIDPALYKQFLNYVKPVYESCTLYTVAEQVNCVLLQSMAPEILGITRNGLEPWI